jgi:hypothetical protein
MTEELFDEDLMNAFVPYIQYLRENPVFAEELGILAMDSVGVQFAVAGRKQNHCSVFPRAYRHFILSS